MVWPVSISKTGVGWLNRELALAWKSILQPALWYYQGVGKKMLRDADGSENEQPTGGDSSVDSSPHGSKYFHEYIYPYAKLDFIKGRLTFVDLTGVSKKTTSAPFPSIVCIYKHAWSFFYQHQKKVNALWVTHTAWRVPWLVRDTNTYGSISGQGRMILSTNWFPYRYKRTFCCDRYASIGLTKTCWPIRRICISIPGR